MRICDICRKEETKFTIDGWVIDDKSLWEYELCNDCYKKIKKLLLDFKTKALAKGDD